METRFSAEQRTGLAFVLLFVVYAYLSTYMVKYGFVHLAMVWNLILAALPVFFALLARKSAEKGGRRASVAVYSLLWLAFFPNAPYMVTDIIHISGRSMFYSVEEQSGTVAYQMSIEPWLVLAHVGVAVICGALFSLFSLHIMHGMLRRLKGFMFSGASVVIACLLGGFAIYIGRFLRFNSWDIFKPLTLLKELYSSMDLFMLQFSLLMAGFILFLYLLFYYLCGMTQEGDKTTLETFIPRIEKGSPCTDNDAQ
jgi:uncharacterized membrane protein